MQDPTEPAIEPEAPPVWFSGPNALLHWRRDGDDGEAPPFPLWLGYRAWVTQGMAHGTRYWHGPWIETRTARHHGYVYTARVPDDWSDRASTRRHDQAAAQLERLIDHIDDQWATDWLPRIVSAHKRLESPTPDTVPDRGWESLWQATDQAGQELWAVHFELVFGAGAVRRTLDEFCGDLFPGEPQYATASLTAGDDNMGIRAGDALAHLAVLVVEHNTLRDSVFQQSWKTLQQTLDGINGGQTFREAFRTFVARYGKKRAGDWLAPTWEEDPEIVLDNLRALIRLGGDYGVSQRRAVAEQARLLRTTVVRRLEGYPRAVRDEYHRLFGAARTAARLFEDHNFYIDQQAAYYYRRLMMAGARKLVARGALTDTAAAVYLEPDELMAAVADPTQDLHEVVASRRKAREHAQALTVPREWGSPSPTPPPHPIFRTPPESPATAPPDPGPAGFLRGVAASTGHAEGPARVIKDLAEARTLNPGDILVTQETSPSWVTWYAILGGLVTESGGILSHAAVVAREYGIPAVLAVTGATQAIRTGQSVEIDGGEGWVRVLSEEP